MRELNSLKKLNKIQHKEPKDLASVECAMSVEVSDRVSPNAVTRMVVSSSLYHLCSAPDRPRQKTLLLAVL